MTKTLTKKKPKITSRWCVDFYGSKMFGSTKQSVLELAANKIQKTEEAGRGWTLSHEWRTERTWWPEVLIISRDYEHYLASFNKTLKTNIFHWTDSCGSRAVYFYGPKYATDYDRAKDLPVTVFEDLQKYFKLKDIEVPLLLRRKDPGTGIFIPEIDVPVINKGDTPDGAIALEAKKEAN
jgi:hypothetical protein